MKKESITQEMLWAGMDAVMGCTGEDGRIDVAKDVYIAMRALQPITDAMVHAATEELRASGFLHRESMADALVVRAMLEKAMAAE